MLNFVLHSAMAWKRSVVLSVTAASSQTLQMPNSGTIKGVLMSAVTAAAGTWELSTSGTSQIATGSPDVGVLARMRIAGSVYFSKLIPKKKG
jgi:hypothetical protein